MPESGACAVASLRPMSPPGAPPQSLRTILAEVRAVIAGAPRLEPDVRADAAREAELLVAGVFDWAPGEVRRRALRETAVREADAQRLRTVAARRAAGEPLAYCVGAAAFRELVLMVDPRVLIPRPETEGVVEAALRVTAATPGGIAVDVGTGSGAIALSLAQEGRFDRIIATDLSADALDVARANADRLGLAARLEFRAGADLAPLTSRRHGVSLARVLVSNPPYIAYGEAAALPDSVRAWEPPVALFAADDGMARYQVLIAGAPTILEPDGWLVLEVDAARGRRTADLAVTHGYRQVRLERDLAGRDRVLVARRPA